MIACVLIVILLSLIGWIFTLLDNSDSDFPYALVGGIVGVIIPCILLLCIVGTTPTALDVYQGKTTLEITYKDSIPVDSVVVFKDEK